MDILVNDEFVRVVFDATHKKTFPKNDYNITFKSGKISVTESGTDIEQLTIKDIDKVSSITDNTTGGPGVVAVPATLTLLFDILEPYFFNSTNVAVGDVILGDIDLNTDDLERSSLVIEANTTKKQFEALKLADDLVETMAYSDAETADERITSITYSSAVDFPGYTAVKTFAYGGSTGTYYVTSVTLAIV